MTRDRTALHCDFYSFPHCFPPFTAFSEGLVAAELQGTSINLTPAFHLSSAGLTNCCGSDTLTEGVPGGWNTTVLTVLPSLIVIPPHLLPPQLSAVLMLPDQHSALVEKGDYRE